MEKRHLNLNFYLIVSAGLFLTAILGALLIFFFPENKKDASSQNNPTSFLSDSGLSGLSKGSVFERAGQNYSLTEPEKGFENRVNSFYSLIDKAEKNQNFQAPNLSASSSEKSLNNEPIPLPLETRPANLTILKKPANVVFPSFYLDYIQSIGRVFKDQGFIPKDKTISLDKTADVFKFFDDSSDYFFKLGTFSEREYPQFRYGLTVVWPMTLEIEFGDHASINSKPYLNGQESPQGVFKKMSSLLNRLIPIAFAQTCARPGAPAPGGVNLLAPCCSCYCGYYPCGCLNAGCTTGAAIFDQTTFICGCG